jgi:hypothetical protein
LRLDSKKRWRPARTGRATTGQRPLFPSAGTGGGMPATFRRWGFRTGSCALVFFALAPLHLAPAAALARIPPGAPTAPHVPPPGLRHNELRLARLEPGKDTLAAAVAIFGPHYRPVFPDSPDLIAWVDRQHERVVRIEVSRDKVIETITVSAIDSLLREKGEVVPAALSFRRLATGRGLGLGDTAQRVLALYGPPNSRGPSTRGSRELEFLFYAFDWAGPDVPQVMEVYCDARTGRVLEITLAAPTL